MSAASKTAGRREWGHWAIISLLACAAGLLAVYVAWQGAGYYRLTLTERPFHPQHIALRSAGSTGIRLGFTAVVVFAGLYLYPLRKRIKRDRASGSPRVTTPKASYRAQFVVRAIGKRGTPRRLGVPVEEQGRLGHAKSGRNPVTLVHRGVGFTRARERNRQLLDKAFAVGRIPPMLRIRSQSIGANTLGLDQSGSIQVEKVVAA